MKTEIIQSLTNDFESYARQTENGVEFWLACDLQHLLGYGKWDNFKSVIAKAKTACEVAGHTVLDHFADAGKMVSLGSGSQREVPDLCSPAMPGYLIAQNGARAKKKSPLKPHQFESGKRRS